MEEQNQKKETMIANRVKMLAKDWDIKIMSYVMLVIVVIAIIAATVAWFFYFRSAAMTGIGMTSATSDSLKVEVKQGTKDGGDNFVELKEGEENTVFAYLDMPVFDNVESYEITIGDSETGEEKKTVSKMAPGVYGSLTIRLTSLNKTIDHYKISPKTIFQYIDTLHPIKLEDGELSDSQTDAEVSRLQKLSKGHILFFADRVEYQGGDTVTIDQNEKAVSDYTHNSKYVFTNPIDEEHLLEGDLKWDETKDEGTPQIVTIYWYWPYEYTNLSSAIKEKIRLNENETDVLSNEDRLEFFDSDKLKEVADKIASWDEVQLYDYADTRIGNNVEKIKLQLKVEGYHEVQDETDSTK